MGLFLSEEPIEVEYVTNFSRPMTEEEYKKIKATYISEKKWNEYYHFFLNQKKILLKSYQFLKDKSKLSIIFRSPSDRDEWQSIIKSEKIINHSIAESLKFSFQNFTTSPKANSLLRKQSFPNYYQEHLREIFIRAHIAISIAHSCEPEKTAVDIGSHTGLYTWLMCATSKKVLSFDPLGEPEVLPDYFFDFLVNPNHELLEKKIQHHDFGLSNEEFLGFYFQNQNPAYNYIKKEMNGTKELTEKTRPVFVKTLDSLNIQDSLSLIKIDAEDLDWPICLGAEKIIDHRRPTIIFESSSFIKDNIELITSWWNTKNYLLLPLEGLNNRVTDKTKPNFGHNLTPYILCNLLAIPFEKAYLKDLLLSLDQFNEFSTPLICESLRNPQNSENMFEINTKNWLKKFWLELDAKRNIKK